LKVNDENSRPRIQDPDPDPLIRGSWSINQRIRIHTKMSWIRNTGIRLFLYTVSHTEGRIQPFSRPQKKYLQRIEFLWSFEELDALMSGSENFSFIWRLRGNYNAREVFRCSHERV
jgi:hypothetical protein